MADLVRRLTDDEVRFYREHGWVHVSALVDPQFVATLAAKAAELHRPTARCP